MFEPIACVSLFLLLLIAQEDVREMDSERVIVAMEELRLRSGGSHHVRFDREADRRYQVCAMPTNRTGDIDLYGTDASDPAPSSYPLSSRNTGRYYRECIAVAAGAAGPFHALVRAERATTYSLSIIESR